MHSANSPIVLLIIPGVDGSVDGFENKYVKMANLANEKHGVAIVRMSNPFVSSLRWSTNIVNALDYIKSNASEICGHDNPEIRVMAHSAGASVIAQEAYKYSQIKSLLLVNMAMNLAQDKIISGLEKFSDKVTFLFGSEDPNYTDFVRSELYDNKEFESIVVAGADHFFSDEYLGVFIEAPTKYLF